MKKLIMLLITLMIISNLFGCTGTPSQNKEPEDTAKIEVVDLKGRSMVLYKIPQSISVTLKYGDTFCPWCGGKGCWGNQLL